MTGERRPTDAEDAARILRGWKRKIERLAETERGDTDNVQLFRSASDTCVCNDTTTVTTEQAASFTFDDDDFGTAEFND